MKPGKTYVLKEHSKFAEEEIQEIEPLNLPFREAEGAPVFLGINEYTSSYYIGAAWLCDSLIIPGKTSAVIVEPKIDVDYVEMLYVAMCFSPSSKYFASFYDIDFDSPTITSPEASTLLTPMLIINFISAVRQLIRKGLKKGYLIREENLKSKVKGRILLSNHIVKNVLPGRVDRTYCKYQDYSEDIPENRIIKKALLFSRRAISCMPALLNHRRFNSIQAELNNLLAFFTNVSEDIDIHHLKNVRNNKLFRGYEDAIPLAKRILFRYGYSIDNVSTNFLDTPPFWIDMSRLFEVYVYSKLVEKYGEGAIEFQVSGHCSTKVDYIKKDKEKLVIDAKYKPRYDYSNSGILEDIREISGYARDTKILKRLGILDNSSEELKCVIVYPVLSSINRESDDISMKEQCIWDSIEREYDSFPDGLLYQACTPITMFRNFAKICISLPKKA